MAESGKGWVWYAAQDPDLSGKLSVLAVVEVAVSVIAYWLIAAVWQTHLHLLVALVATPLVLLRSEASVAWAQKMWDIFVDANNDIFLRSKKGLLAIALTVFSLFSAVLFLSIYASFEHKSWIILYQLILVTLFMWYVGLVTAVFVIGVAAIIPITKAAGNALRAMYIPHKAAGIIVMLALAPAFCIGFWIRSLLIRTLSILPNILEGIYGISENWRRVILCEDATHIPEILPGVKQSSPTFKFGGMIKRMKNGDIVVKSLGVFVILLLYVPALIWRYSLKSTFWFYAPLIYIASPGKFADPAHRRLMVDRAPPLLEIIRFVASLVALAIAIVALIDWPFLHDLLRKTEVFSPVGWVLILDWNRIWTQPWQVPSILGAALTVTIFLWIDSLRKTRTRLEKDGADPETAMDRAYGTEHHPGLTLYRLNRLRTVLVTLSLVIGFVYFTKGSYEAGYLTRIEPMLSSIFGPR